VNPDKSSIRIYSLYSPPVSLSQLQNSQSPKKTSGYLLTVIISLLMIIGFICFVYFFRKSKKVDSNASIENNSLKEITQIQEERQPVRKSNAFYVLGDFAAFDKNGKDITYRFSAKIQSLVADILLSQKTENGITTQKLTSDLWPEKNPKVAKNIRGVTINHLRNILEDMRGIQLICDNSKWFFSIYDDFYCDYLHTLKIVAEIPESKTSGILIQQLAGLIKRGSLLRNTETEWIDDYKQKYETQVEQLLTTQLQTDYNQEYFQNALNLSDALFVIDPLNEEVLLTTIRILKKTGKIEHSQNLYNRFSLRYKTIMGENYPVKYTSI
jgi:two-component SAPR family response regulator